MSFLMLKQPPPPPPSPKENRDSVSLHTAIGDTQHKLPRLAKVDAVKDGWRGDAVIARAATYVARWLQQFEFASALFVWWNLTREVVLEILIFRCVDTAHC
jgi:hypothetical protein